MIYLLRDSNGAFEMSLNTYEQGIVVELAELAMREHKYACDAYDILSDVLPRSTNTVNKSLGTCNCGADEHNTKVLKALCDLLVFDKPLSMIKHSDIPTPFYDFTNIPSEEYHFL